MEKENVLFVFPGNARTFLLCFDSCYEQIITKLYPIDSNNVYLYFYLKLTDPGPKGQDQWNFSYKDVSESELKEKIESIKLLGVNVDCKLLFSNEISDDDLYSQVCDVSKYVRGYSIKTILIRGLHCHYNLERCGNYILEKEGILGSEFKSIVYVRPDLFFTEKCAPASNYNTNIVTLGAGPSNYNNDHLALIPRQYMNAFFFDRMALYRTNTTIEFESPETVYWHTIKYIVQNIGKYCIKRS
jgi:hypothetical protein